MKKLLVQTAIAGAMMVTASAASAACVQKGPLLFQSCTLDTFANTYFSVNYAMFADLAKIKGIFGGNYWVARVFTDGTTYDLVGSTFNLITDAHVSDTAISVPFEAAGAGIPALAAMAGYLAWRRRTVQAA